MDEKKKKEFIEKTNKAFKNPNLLGGLFYGKIKTNENTYDNELIIRGLSPQDISFLIQTLVISFQKVVNDKIVFREKIND